jgi:hypothetical protein
MKSTDQRIPSHFEVSIGGFGGRCYRVAWTAGALRYYVSDYVSDGYPIDRLEAVIEPTSGGWERFWAAMGEVELWTWNASYNAPGILDGTQWEVTIERGERRVASSGSNRYPGYREEGVDDGHVTSRFERFTGAVSALIGGQPFE